MPVLVLAMTSDTLPTSAIFDAADLVIAQRVSQVPGVAEARLAGAEQPAIRVEVDSARLAAMGLGVDAVANALNAANAHSAVGALGGYSREITLATTDQLSTPDDYRNIVIASRNGAVVKLGDVAKIVTRRKKPQRRRVVQSGKPAVPLIVAKQPNANVIETVDQIRAPCRGFKNGFRAASRSTCSPTARRRFARALRHQRTPAISVVLVMMVVYVFCAVDAGDSGWHHCATLWSALRGDVGRRFLAR